MGTIITCENCGTVGNTDDGYCKNCWKKLVPETEEDDAIIEGIGRSAWKDFIDKNHAYYLPIFEKNEGKKIFVKINWAALFFGTRWLFYRKMYKITAMLYALMAVVSLLLVAVFTLVYAGEVKELQVTVDSYEAYVAAGGETVAYGIHGDAFTPQIVKDGWRAQDRIDTIQMMITLYTSLIVGVVYMLVTGLFGNALYKAHVKKNIHEPRKGGASITSVIFGCFVMNAIESAVSYGLVFLMLLLFV
ncbi:MAG: DUF2628 domain-containing protein [Clostridia bacterium]|nr:DUF2628 domain-containing protein [Clostridia bacterium]